MAIGSGYRKLRQKKQTKKEKEREKEKEVRKVVLERDRYRCQYPGCKCMEVSFLEVHHIITRSKKRIRFDKGNCITLCRNHHRNIMHGTSKESREKRDYFYNVVLPRKGFNLEKLRDLANGI